MKIEQIALGLIKVIKPSIYKNITRELLWRNLKNNAKIEYVNRSEIKIGEIKHKILPKDLMLRITNLNFSLFNILEFDLEKMIENFKRDLNPYDEVRVWEFINLCFQKYLVKIVDCKNKKEIIEQLIMLSLGILEKNNGISENEFLIILKLWTENYPLYANINHIDKDKKKRKYKEQP